MTTSATAVDEGRLQEFVGRFAGDLGAALHQTTVLIGDKLGLYAAMSDGEPVTPGELAALIEHRRAVRPRWLCAQAASAYAEYEAGQNVLPHRPGGLPRPLREPTFLPAPSTSLSPVRDSRRRRALPDRRRVGWDEHHEDCSSGPSVLPARLRRQLVPLGSGGRRGRGEALAGAPVVDIGCGHGVSTI